MAFSNVALKISVASSAGSTIFPKSSFNAIDACKTLKKSIKGLGSDEKKIIEVICGYNCEQRQIIKNQFMKLYNQNIESLLKSNLDFGEHFEYACSSLFKKKYQLESDACRNAIKSHPVDELTLIEILCSRSYEEIKLIKQIYKEAYNQHLSRDLENVLTGDLNFLIRSLASSTRLNHSDSSKIDSNVVTKDSIELFDSGQGRFGTDECEFTRLLCYRNYAHLNRVFDEYKILCSGKDIGTVIREETTGLLCNALELIVKCIQNRPAYFAQQINECVKVGNLVDIKKLTRIIITRSEVDLENTKFEYQKLYKKPLADDICCELTGEYRKLIRKLIQGNR